MNTPNKTITDLTIKEDFKGNHTRLQGEKRPLEPKGSRVQEQGSILLSTRIDPYKKTNLEENIPLRIDPSKVKIDPFLSVMVFSRFSRFRNLNFHAKDRSL